MNPNPAQRPDRSWLRWSWPERPNLSASRALAALVAVLVVLVAASLPAGAHGGEAQIELVSMETGAQPMQRNVTVSVTYGDDNHHVDDATVTVGGSSDGGDALVPVTLQPMGEGRFSGTVEFPAAGTWNLTVTVVDPPGQLQLDPVVVTAPTTVTEPVTQPETDPQDAVTADTQPTEPASQSSNEPTQGAGDSNEDSSDFPVGAVIAALLVVVVGAATWLVLRGRNQDGQNQEDRHQDTNGDPTDGSVTDGATDGVSDGVDGP